MAKDYSAVTEVPGFGVTDEAMRALYTRYEYAASFTPDRDVLEVGAGPGFGLGWYARKARRVVGTDITPGLVRRAKDTFGTRLDVATTDATSLPFQDRTFDVIVFYEAIYYLADASAFFREAHRVLRPGGRVVVCTANKHRPGFVRSPHSQRYHDGAELRAFMERAGFDQIELSLAFPASPPGLAQRAILLAFSVGDKLRIIPRTLEGRAKMKRLLYGNLQDVPAELTPGALAPEPFHAWRADDEKNWKVIYVTGKKAA